MDAVADLTKLGISVGKVIINATHPPLLASGRVTQADLRRGLAAADLPTDRATVAGLYAEANAHLTRRALEESLRAELAELGRPMLELPLLPGGVTRAELDLLAGELLAAG
jgi:hypothetical protein